MKSSQLAPFSTKTPRIAALTRSLVSGSPSSSSTPSAFGLAAPIRSRAAPIAGVGRGLGAADALELGAGLRAAALGRTTSRSAVSSTPAPRSRSASSTGKLAGTVALLDAERAHRTERDLVADLRRSEAAAPQLVDAELLERVELEAVQVRQHAGSPSS